MNWYRLPLVILLLLGTALIAPGSGRAADQDPQSSPDSDERYELARQDHWAYQPVRRPTPPQVNDQGWVRMPLDQFVLAKLESAGLAPSPEVDRRTLIRRATVDLWGVPPTPEQVDAFVSDPAPDAYERLLDRLLASPRYGERWARHWLDVARYADTRGYAFERERRYPYAYTYRDYVIRSLNEDLPYDRFVLEQLAADQLPLAEQDREHALAAMGYLTVGRKFNNMHDDIDDQIDVTTRGLLGLTVACARCHDHKYDAIPTADYYSLYGVFASSEEPDELPLLGTPEPTAAYQEFQTELAKRQKELHDFLAAKHKELIQKARASTTEYLVRVVSHQSEELLQKLPYISLSPEELRPKLIERWRRYLREQARPDHPVLGPLDALVQVDEEQFGKKAEDFLQRWTSVPTGLDDGQVNPLVRAALADHKPQSKVELAHVYGQLFDRVYQRWQQTSSGAEQSGELSEAEQQVAELLLGEDSPTDIAVEDIVGYLNRADRNAYGDLQKKIDSYEVSAPGAPPRAMALLDRKQLHEPRIFIRGNHAQPGERVPRQFLAVLSEHEREPFAHGSGRLDLARAIVDPANPLTRRVIANRWWMHHFGEPLVDQPSDFGIRSDEPVHAALLDYLAWRLLDGGWSLKALHREMMLSSTYRQSSTPRPEALVTDPENRLWWRMQVRRLEWEALHDSLLMVAQQLDTRMYGRPVELLNPPYSQRRGVYGFIDRQDLPNLFRVFDFASPDQSSADRPRTTVPQQALFLMNSPIVIEQASTLAAQQSLQDQPSLDERIKALYRIVLQRQPTEDELAIGRQFVEDTPADTDSKLSAWQQYVQLLLLSNEFMFID